MKPKNVLVVGGAGYIGTHMVKELLAAGHKPVTLDDLSKGNRDLLPGGGFFEGDFGDAETIEEVLSKHPLDIVMHFGAHSLVGESVLNTLKYYENNISKTLVLIKSMLKQEVRHFVFSSSAAVYGEPEETPITESHPCRPTNPYGSTKLVLEQILRDFDAAYGLKYASLRYFNAAGADESSLFGERHDPETHLIPLVMKAALGVVKEVSVFGSDYPTPDGTCVRDYVHVTDLAKAHLLAMDYLIAGGPSRIYNLGNSRGYSVREMIKTAERVTGAVIPAVLSDRRPGDPAILVASSERIKADLGWRPQYEDLETIVRTAWNWHKKDKLRSFN